MQYTRALLVFALLTLAACTTPPAIQHTTLPVSVRPSANFDERRANYVILHYTSSETADRALRTLTDPASKVSAHYLIAQAGKIARLVDERARAGRRAGARVAGGRVVLGRQSRREFVRDRHRARQQRPRSVWGTADSIPHR